MIKPVMTIVVTLDETAPGTYVPRASAQVGNMCDEHDAYQPLACVEFDGDELHFWQNDSDLELMARAFLWTMVEIQREFDERGKALSHAEGGVQNIGLEIGSRY
jgi:hypothetical protein